MQPSTKLQLVKQFLPQLKQDNDRIFQEIDSFPINKSKFDIENIDNTDGPLIEMVTITIKIHSSQLLLFRIFRIYFHMKNLIVIVNQVYQTQPKPK